QLLEMQKSNVPQKSNLGTLTDSQEFPEEKPQSPQDYHHVVKLLERQKSKWTSRIQTLCHEHEREKSRLLSEIEKLRSTVKKDTDKNHSFYKRRIEELEQKLKEQNGPMSAEKKQIKELSPKSVTSVKPYDVNTTVEHLEESKPSLPVVHETEKSDREPGRNNNYLRNVLKTVPSLTKELRIVLEQTLEEKLDYLGIKPGVRGIPNDHLHKILRAIASARESKEKQEPDIRRIREHLQRQVCCMAEEKSASCGSNRPVSWPQLPSEEKQKFSQLGISSSATPQKEVRRSSTTVRPAEQKTVIPVATSTAKKLFENEVSRETSSLTTSPFSSEDEADEDTKPLYTSPELVQKQSRPSSSKVSAFQRASGKSTMDGMEGSEMEKSGTTAKTSKGTVIQKLSKQVGKSLSKHGNKNKPAGGIHVAQAFVKEEEVKDLKFTEMDEDDWDLSSAEDLLPVKDDKGQKALTAQKSESTNAASVVHGWGPPKTSVPKEEGLQEGDNTSTLKSSLVTVTDWSDSSDI
ncbi:PREDICTED: zinc finger protein DZIP1, partial [Merops nubicus]|uniref:zinc finger protein DZIP1 n=1 Tax=Merops nubicus TaxID=57421 RepID=UPI0004F09850